MINNDRIVPVQKIDLLSLYGTVMKLAQVEYDVLAANNVEGDFSVTGSGDVGLMLANQPVKTCDFADGVSGGVVLFVPAYDYEGFTVAGAAATYAEGSETVNPDGVTLYKAVLASGDVTVTAVTPVLE